MTAGITRKNLKRDEFVEATLDAGHWVEHHWKPLAGGAAALALVALAVVGWIWNAERNRTRAERELAEGARIFREADGRGFPPAEVERALASFELALERGDGDAARHARYWRGAALLQLGRNDEAIAALEPLAADAAAPPTLLGSARALLARAHVAAGQVDPAIDILEKLAQAEPEIFPADQALLELGDVLEQRGDSVKARAAWQQIVDKHATRGSVAEARQRLGR